MDYVERGQGQFSGKELKTHLLTARVAKPIAEDQLQCVVHQLERQCRNVPPSYRPDAAA